MMPSSWHLRCDSDTNLHRHRFTPRDQRLTVKFEDRLTTSDRLGKISIWWELQKKNSLWCTTKKKWNEMMTEYLKE